MTVVAYTDASFSCERGIGVCGFIAKREGLSIAHNLEIVGGLKYADRAEIHAVVMAIQYCFLLPDVSKIIVRTDCRNIVFRGKKEKYKELEQTLEVCREYNVSVEISHVKGHVGHPTNEKIDQSVRTHLRQYLKQNPVP